MPIGEVTSFVSGFKKEDDPPLLQQTVMGLPRSLSLGSHSPALAEGGLATSPGGLRFAACARGDVPHRTNVSRSMTPLLCGPALRKR